MPVAINATEGRGCDKSVSLLAHLKAAVSSIAGGL